VDTMTKREKEDVPVIITFSNNEVTMTVEWYDSIEDYFKAMEEELNE